MRRRLLGVLIACVVAAVAISAVAFGPAAFRNLGSPNAPGGPNGPEPQVTSIDRPTWHAGDTWTYTVNTTSVGMRPMADGPSAVGSLTRTVVSVDASQANVSIAGSFHIRWMVDATPMAGAADAAKMAVCNGMFENATLGGYTWYQTSDLAILKEVRTLEVQGSSMTPMGTYVASYKAVVETSFDPALKVWSFPLQANETWIASSNATIHASTHWQLTGPNVSWDVHSIFNAQVPVRLFLHSGEPETLTTPAGTFSAIPVGPGHPELDPSGAPPDASADRAMGFDHEIPVRGDRASTAWFSGTAKNVVQSSVFTMGFRLTLTLTSYHLG